MDGGAASFDAQDFDAQDFDAQDFDAQDFDAHHAPRDLLEAELARLAEENRQLLLFASRAAHDLKGPLALISGYASLLEQRTDLPAEVIEIATKLREIARGASQAVDEQLRERR